MAMNKAEKINLLRKYEADYTRRGQEEDLIKIESELLSRGEKPLRLNDGKEEEKSKESKKKNN